MFQTLDISSKASLSEYERLDILRPKRHQRRLDPSPQTWSGTWPSWVTHANFDALGSDWGGLDVQENWTTN